MKLKPKSGFVKNELNTERLTPLQWDGIMRAMDNYALHFNSVQKQANEFKPSDSGLNIDIVNNRRELLIGFGFYVTNGNYRKLCNDVRTLVDKYLKAN